jgi:glutamate dehydrogenase
VHFVLGDRLALDAVRDHIVALPRADRWQTEARAALRDDFYESHAALDAAVLAETPTDASPEARVVAWTEQHRDAVDRFRSVVDDIEAAGVFDLTTLAVARRALRELAEGVATA